MKIGGWEIYLGFLYFRLPEDWEDLDEAFMRARPSWNNLGLHMWHGNTDEGHMLEIRLSRKYGARVSYSHLPAFWFAATCKCDDCRLLRRKLRAKRGTSERLA